LKPIIGRFFGAFFSENGNIPEGYRRDGVGVISGQHLLLQVIVKQRGLVGAAGEDPRWGD